LRGSGAVERRSRRPASGDPLRDGLAGADALSETAGDLNVLAGTFDDAGITRTTRRIALLGGRMIARAA
jgi:hypothetical protein